MKKIYATPCMKVYNVCGNSAFLSASDVYYGGSNKGDDAPKVGEVKERDDSDDLWDEIKW